MKIYEKVLFLDFYAIILIMIELSYEVQLYEYVEFVTTFKWFVIGWRSRVTFLNLVKGVFICLLII